MSSLLKERGYSFDGFEYTAITNIIKEERNVCCYAALFFDGEMKREEVYVKEYELPDGQVLSIGKERFRCPEALSGWPGRSWGS